MDIIKRNILLYKLRNPFFKLVFLEKCKNIFFRKENQSILDILFPKYVKRVEETSSSVLGDILTFCATWIQSEERAELNWTYSGLEPAFFHIEHDLNFSENWDTTENVGPTLRTTNFDGTGFPVSTLIRFRIARHDSVDIIPPFLTTDILEIQNGDFGPVCDV